MSDKAGRLYRVRMRLDYGDDNELEVHAYAQDFMSACDMARRWYGDACGISDKYVVLLAVALVDTPLLGVD